MVEVSNNTWWIDSGSTIHISNSLQGITNLKRPVESEESIYSGYKMCSRVEGVGTCSLVFRSSFILNLEKSFYIPSFSRNLIYVSRFVLFGYSFQFSDKSLLIYYKSDIVENGTLSYSLFSIDL